MLGVREKEREKDDEAEAERSVHSRAVDASDGDTSPLPDDMMVRARTDRRK